MTKKSQIPNGIWDPELFGIILVRILGLNLKSEQDLRLKKFQFIVRHEISI